MNQPQQETNNRDIAASHFTVPVNYNTGIDFSGDVKYGDAEQNIRDRWFTKEEKEKRPSLPKRMKRAHDKGWDETTSSYSFSDNYILNFGDYNKAKNNLDTTMSKYTEEDDEIYGHDNMVDMFAIEGANALPYVELNVLYGQMYGQSAGMAGGIALGPGGYALGRSFGTVWGMYQHTALVEAAPIAIYLKENGIEDDNVVRAYALVGGALSAAIEVIQMKQIIGNKLAGKMSKKAIRNAVARASLSMHKKGGGKFTRDIITKGISKTKDLVKFLGIQGSEESAQSFLTDIAKIGGDAFAGSDDTLGLGDMFKNMGTSFVDMMKSGPMLWAVGLPMDAFNEHRFRSQVRDEFKDKWGNVIKVAEQIPNLQLWREFADKYIIDKLPAKAKESMGKIDRQVLIDNIYQVAQENIRDEAIKKTTKRAPYHKFTQNKAQIRDEFELTKKHLKSDYRKIELAAARDKNGVGYDIDVSQDLDATFLETLERFKMALANVSKIHLRINAGVDGEDFARSYRQQYDAWKSEADKPVEERTHAHPNETKHLKGNVNAVDLTLHEDGTWRSIRWTGEDSKLKVKDKNKARLTTDGEKAMVRGIAKSLGLRVIEYDNEGHIHVELMGRHEPSNVRHARAWERINAITVDKIKNVDSMEKVRDNAELETAREKYEILLEQTEGLKIVLPKALEDTVEAKTLINMFEALKGRILDVEKKTSVENSVRTISEIESVVEQMKSRGHPLAVDMQRLNQALYKTKEQMDVGDVEYLSNVITSLAHQINRLDKFYTFTDESYIKTRDKLGKLIDIEPLPKGEEKLIRSFNDIISGKDETRESLIAGLARGSININMLFHKIDGSTDINTVDNDGFMASLFFAFHEKQQHENENNNNHEKVVKGVHQGLNYKDLMIKKIDFGVKGVDPITMDNAMHLYASSYGYANREHLGIGKFDKINELIMKIDEKLPEENKQMVHRMFAYQDNEIFPRLYKVVKNVYGVELKKEDFYFAIIALGNKSLIDGTVDMVYNSMFDTKSIFERYDKGLRTAKGYKNYKYFDTINRGLVATEHFIQFAEITADARKLLNSEDVLQGVAKKLDERGVRMIARWLRDIENGNMTRKQLGTLDTGLRWLRYKAIRATLAARAATVIKQSASVIFGAEYVGPSHIIRGLNAFAENPEFITTFVEGKTEMVRNRGTNMERDLIELVNDIANEKGTFKTVQERKQFVDWLMSFITSVDKATVVPIWYGAYMKALNESTLTNEAEREQNAIRYADTVIIETQPTGNIMYLSDVFRGSEMERQLTPYKNQRNKILNMLYNSFTEFKSSNKSIGDYFSLARRGSVPLLLNQVSMTIIGALFSWRTPELWRFGVDYIGQYTGGIPGLNEMTMLLLLAIADEPYLARMQTDIMAYQGILDIASTIGDVYSGDTFGALHNATRAVGKLTGTPVDRPLDVINWFLRVAGERE